MTEQQHPITPPKELVEKWRAAPEYTTRREKLMMVSMTTQRLQEIATQSARWGADAQLETCCEWLAQETPEPYINALRAAMRPKPPRLAEQALDTLKTKKLLCFDHPEGYDIIRRALKRLQELEKGNE